MRTHTMIGITAGVLLLSSFAALADSPKGWMMGPGMMYGRGGMMGGVGGYCPHMTGEGKVEVKEVKNGITITITSEKKDEIARIQKHGQVMKIMHELYQSEPEAK